MARVASSYLFEHSAGVVLRFLNASITIEHGIWLEKFTPVHGLGVFYDWLPFYMSYLIYLYIKMEG